MNQPKHLQRWFLVLFILALCGLGAWTSGQMLKVHDHVWEGAASGSGLFAQLCQVAANAGVACVAAADSPWAALSVPLPLPHGFSVSIHTLTVPLAFLGLAYFLALAVWFAFAGGPRPIGAGWHKLVLSVALCGAAVSLFFLGIMVLDAAPWCLACVAVHGVNFLIVLAVWRLGATAADAGSVNKNTTMQQMVGMTLSRREATTTIAFALILIGGLWSYRHAHLSMRNHVGRLAHYRHIVMTARQDPQFLMREYLAQPRHSVPLRDSETAAADSPQIAVFTDFECHACYCTAMALEQRAAEVFDGNVTLLVRHFPLSSTCNDAVSTDKHPNACDAAYAAEAARLQGGQDAVWRMHEALLANHETLGEGTYRQLARELGLDPNLLIENMRDPQVRQVVADDVALARSLGVYATPTLFVDGRRVTELCEGPVFWDAIARGQHVLDDHEVVAVPAE